jgi:protein-tyrosine phosphatase
MLASEGLSNVEVDSAGTSAWHEGEEPDGRSTYHASLRGYKLEGSSRAVTVNDFKHFDVLFAMDAKNHFDLEQICPEASFESKIKLITDFCKIHEQNKVGSGVPDPYYKGEEGFGFVLDIIEDASREIVNQIKEGKF